ncbi:MAG TPA: HPr family phosphocarrier protein [Phycisphaerae bacterium]|nr:HPr family phosphocarrier protein [Phycisphaerae bacterium]
MAQVEKEITIINKYGLHARPAMQVVQLAQKYASNIEVAKDALKVDAKSIMSVMRLAATKGTKLKISADGEDAQQAIDALTQLIADGFGELEPAGE